MLIVSGYKVFSIEVEDKLSQLSEIELCAVVGTLHEQRSGSEVVNLFAQLSTETATQDPDEVKERIIRFCRDNMSSYKVPKKIHFVNSLPVTAVGKLDKKVMRELALTA